jgi:hypothetical protein
MKRERETEGETNAMVEEDEPKESMVDKWKKHLKENGRELKYAPYWVRSDKALVLDAVGNDGKALRYASDALRNDKEVVCAAAVSAEFKALLYASDDLKNDPDLFLTLMRHDRSGACLFKYASQRLRSDKKFVLDIVGIKGYCLKYVSERLRDDEDVVDTAVNCDKRLLLISAKTSSYPLLEASKRLKNDINVVLEVVRVFESNHGPNSWVDLSYANDELALEIVKRDGLLIRGMWRSSHNDDDTIVMEAVKQNGLALQYASSRIKDFETIVTEAVKQNGLALEFASDRLKDDVNVTRIAAKQNPSSIQFVSRRIAEHGVYQNPRFFQFVSKQLRDDPTFVWLVVRKDGMQLQYASAFAKNSEGVVVAALQQNKNAFQFLIPENQDWIRQNRPDLIPNQ